VSRSSAVPPPVTAVLDAGSAWLPTRLGAVERMLQELAAGHGELLREDVTATLAAGGKRLRPLLVLLCAGPPGGDAAVRAGSAIAKSGRCSARRRAPPIAFGSPPTIRATKRRARSSTRWPLPGRGHGRRSGPSSPG